MKRLLFATVLFLSPWVVMATGLAVMSGDSDKVHGQGDVFTGDPPADIGDFEGTVTGNTLILTIDGEQVDFSWDEGGPILGEGFYLSDSWMLPLKLLTVCVLSNLDGCIRWGWALQVQSLPSGEWVTVGEGTMTRSP